MIPPFEYQSPGTLTEACRLLGEWGPRGKIIAGGTDLIVSLRKGEAQPQILIDITRIPELRRIEEAGRKIRVGAAVTNGEIASSKLIQQYGKVLSDAASWVGSPQIRNLGTIGGNIVNASSVALGLVVFGCAGEMAMTKPTPSKILPIKVTVDSIERLNAITPKPPYPGTDVFVFRVNFRLTNPNNVLAKVDDLYFEAKVEDGTPQKTIVQAASMPSMVISAGGELVWSPTDIFVYGGVLGQFITRGLDGGEGMKGALQKREEFWTELGADKRKFFIDGNITTSLPDAPGLGTVRNQFKTEFAVPGL